jgi:hypothetical protein
MKNKKYLRLQGLLSCPPVGGLQQDFLNTTNNRERDSNMRFLTAGFLWVKSSSDPNAEYLLLNGFNFSVLQLAFSLYRLRTFYKYK